MPSSDSTLNPSFTARLLTPYRRITSSGQFIPEIDGLRFVAIFFVYIYHLAGDILRHSQPGQLALTPYWLFSVTQILSIGVPLFFVISGFILGMPFAAAHLNRQRPVALKKYFWRRVTRLEPPYVLCLIVFFLLKVAGGRGSAGGLFPHLMASIFYVHNLVYGSPSVINFVAWSLEIEIQFYVLAPLLALVFAISSPIVRRSLIVALLILGTGLSRFAADSAVLQHSIAAYLQYFLAGFLLVEYYLAAPAKRSLSWHWDLLSVCGWSLFLALLVQGGAAAEWGTPWIILLLYIAAFRGPVMNKFVSNMWITTIGGMCYTIYLLHNYLVASAGLMTEWVVSTSPFFLRLLVQFALITPFVLLVSALYFRCIERPCMRPDWPQRLKSALDRVRLPRELAQATVSSARASTDK